MVRDNEIKRALRRIKEAEQAGPPLETIVLSAQELNRTRSRVPKTDSDFERLLTPKETAQFLRVSLSWLAKARMRGDGPPFIKLGRSIRYSETALRLWMRAHQRLSTSQQ